MLGIILLILLFITYLLIKDNYRKNSIDNYDVLEMVETKKESKNKDRIDDNVIVESVENNIDVNTKQKGNIEVTKSINSNNDEEDVVAYFESNVKIINNSEFKDKLKEYFVEIVDFIFYGTEINGHRFDELTNTGKLKIISAALKIDSYIEEKSPGYKDTIAGTSSRVYTNVKEKLTILFLDISSNICKYKENDCNNAKELFGEIKSTCKIGWSVIKDLLKNGGNKLKDWYEIYSGK